MVKIVISDGITHHAFYNIHFFLNLVGGFNPSEKHESQLGSLFPIYGKIKFMFQTTNQIILQIFSGGSCQNMWGGDGDWKDLMRPMEFNA